MPWTFQCLHDKAEATGVPLTPCFQSYGHGPLENHRILFFSKSAIQVKLPNEIHFS
jgi:hypothetical protein